MRYLYKLVFDRLINRTIDMECVCSPMQGLVHKHIFLFCLLVWPRSHDILITIRSPRTQKNLKFFWFQKVKSFAKRENNNKNNTEPP